MEVLLVRHGESEGNVEGRMQGHRDYPLSERGREQAATLAAWLRRHAIAWDAAYRSPLLRASQTAALLSELCALPAATPEPDLAELRAGSLEGLTRDDMVERYPHFLERGITELGDFSEFGGEGYNEVQQRARRLFAQLEQQHREAGHRVLLVGHGGINFQLLKLMICEPVPRVCIVRMGNCSATLVRLRQRRDRYIGEVAWHVPIRADGGRVGRRRRFDVSLISGLRGNLERPERVCWGSCPSLRSDHGALSRCRCRCSSWAAAGRERSTQLTGAAEVPAPKRASPGLAACPVARAVRAAWRPVASRHRIFPRGPNASTRSTAGWSTAPVHRWRACW